MKIVEYYNSDIVFEDLIRTIENTSKNNIKPNGNKLLELGKLNAPVISWFQECINEFTSQMYLDEIKLEITECWATKTEKFSNHKSHTHPNSIISGIFYITDHENSKTIFYEENPWNWCNSVFSQVVKEPELKTEVQPKRGKLILFPSNLKHSTSIHYYDSPRYTLSFNTFFNCNFGDFTFKINLKQDHYK